MCIYKPTNSIEHSDIEYLSLSICVQPYCLGRAQTTSPVPPCTPHMPSWPSGKLGRRTTTAPRRSADVRWTLARIPLNFRYGGVLPRDVSDYSWKFVPLCTEHFHAATVAAAQSQRPSAICVYHADATMYNTHTHTRIHIYIHTCT